MDNQSVGGTPLQIPLYNPTSSLQEQNGKIVKPYKDTIIKLAKQALNVDFNANVKQIQILVRQNNLTNQKLKKILMKHGFEISELTRLVSTVFDPKTCWKQGDPLSAELAEQFLFHAPINTWLLRRDETNDENIVTVRTAEGFDHHLNPDLGTSAQGLLLGLSNKFRFDNMLIPPSGFQGTYCHAGTLTDRDASYFLSKTPPMTWLVRNTPDEGDMLDVVTSHKDVEEFLLPNLVEKKIYSIGEFILWCNNLSSDIKIKLEGYVELVKPALRSIEHTEVYVEHIFQHLPITDQASYKLFKKYNYFKISRKKYKVFEASYIIQQTHSTDLKIFQVVHGKKGVLGSGGMKTAKCLRDISTDENFVRSKFRDFSPTELHQKYPQMDTILKKVENLPFVSAGHLVVFKSHKTNKENIAIMSTFAVQDLFEAIQEGLGDEEKRDYPLHILTAIEGVHALGIAHRDIKPENINLIEDPSTGCLTANLADFDYATMKMQIDICGTPLYIAPEIARGEFSTMEDLLKADVYAAGMVLYIIETGYHLWFDSSESKEIQIEKLRNYISISTEEEYIVYFPEPLEGTLMHLCWEMMHAVPSKRPSISECKLRYQSLIKQQ